MKTKMKSISSILGTATQKAAPAPTIETGEEENQVQFLLRIPASLHSEVKAKAAAQRKSMKAVVEELLGNWVKGL
jgi:predicted HicB family RNase H-like nuclease